MRHGIGGVQTHLNIFIIAPQSDSVTLSAQAVMDREESAKYSLVALLCFEKACRDVSVC